jgi:thioester reductase-like protein
VECDAAWDRPLLGDPIASARYAIEDGELLIGGPGVARGYLDAPALTRARFVFRDGQRWFRTGDLVRRDPDGALVFAGRRDRQRKVRGQLVAPEEIEGCIASHPSVVRAVVDLDHGPVAYLETRDAVCEATLRDHVAASLPSYMIPVRFVFQSRLPTTAAGKVDVGALDPTLTALLSVVGRVLAMPPPDSSARFADLGGTSLSALEVVAAMEALGVPISADALLCSSSLSALTLDGAAARDETPTVAALERDALALLDLPTIRACAQGAAVETYLVTGATGSLGARIAQGLLQETRATIVCLVRGERTRALERTLDALSAHGPVDRERLVVHNGDLTSPLLGIDEARHASLAASVDHVVHAAARVSVTAPLAALYPANVEGTGRILELAMTGRPKRFTYASTLSVFVGTEDREGTFLETRWPNPDARVFGGYAQSKVAAESLVRRAAAHLSATQIIRYGLLTGDTETGRAAPGAWLDRTIRGLSRLGVVPEDADPDLAFDVTPVDWAAAATVRLVTRDRGPLSVFHVAGERAVSFRVLRRALDREGVSLEDVPRDHFVARVNALLAESNDSDVGAACLALSRLLGPASARRHRGLDLFEATRTRFDASRTLTVLAGETPRPLPTDALLRRYVESALEART